MACELKGERERRSVHLSLQPKKVEREREKLNCTSLMGGPLLGFVDFGGGG